jgi:hypothetical protein
MLQVCLGRSEEIRRQGKCVEGTFRDTLARYPPATAPSTGCVQGDRVLVRLAKALCSVTQEVRKYARVLRVSRPYLSTPRSLVCAISASILRADIDLVLRVFLC